MYAKYNGAKHLRPWACRSTVNYKAGMVYNHGTSGLHIDHLNVPVNPGTPAGGNRKTAYMRKKVSTAATAHSQYATTALNPTMLPSHWHATSGTALGCA